MEMTPDEIRLAIRYYAKRYRGRIALVVVALLAMAILSTVFYSVEADSEGVVLRFGKYSDTTLPGLHTKWPWPIETTGSPWSRPTANSRSRVGETSRR